MEWFRSVLEVVFLSVCKSSTLSLTFHQAEIWPFYHFSICFLSFYTSFVLAEFFFVPRRFISILLHVHLCKLPFICWNLLETKNFDYQGFISLASDFSFQHFNVKKLWQKKLNLLANVSISGDSIMLLICHVILSTRHVVSSLVVLSCLLVMSCFRHILLKKAGLDSGPWSLYSGPPRQTKKCKKITPNYPPLPPFKIL